MGMESITPEHICIALCKSKNTGGVRALHGCAAHESPMDSSLPLGTCTGRTMIRVRRTFSTF